jgi:hypothetical protein
MRPATMAPECAAIDAVRGAAEDRAPDSIWGKVVVLGMSIAVFTVLHVIISVIAIAAGFVVLGGMFSSHRLPGWTALFLVFTVLTSVTGFMFPITAFTPALGTGIVASVVLVVTFLALYAFNLSGRWRAVYVVTAVISLYLNVFVFIVQGFQKVTFLQPFAPTGSEPPFLVAQLAALAVFIALGFVALVKFHPERNPAF